MKIESINQVLASTLNNALATSVEFFPRLVSGLIILIIGLIIASFLRQVILRVLKFLKLDQFISKFGIPAVKGKDTVDWAVVLAEIARWFVIVLFLVPTADVWGLGRFVEVLNNFLTYLPNVFVAVLLLLVGFVASKLVYDLLFASVRGVSVDAAKTVALVGRWAVLVFISLVVLNQLGIASDLIRILFAGIVAMLSLAGGLAFGLGGKEAARELLDKLIKKL